MTWPAPPNVQRRWTLPPEPKGDDEEEAIAAYLNQCQDSGLQAKPWERLDEWKRQAWRREIRTQPFMLSSTPNEPVRATPKGPVRAMSPSPTTPREAYRPMPIDFLLLEGMPEQGTIGGVHWKGRRVADLTVEITEATDTTMTSGFVQGRMRAMKLYGFVADYPATGPRVWARTPAGSELLGRKEALLNG